MSKRRSSSAALWTEAAPVFAALGDATRLKIVARLSADGPLSITQLTDGADVTRQAVTKHLVALADVGLVHDERAGRERIFRLETKRLEKARRCIDEISVQWDGALARLKDFVERGDE
jgi:DNA-binding transcriptional ArsR family regulator